jgi:hypothetical protein
MYPFPPLLLNCPGLEKLSKNLGTLDVTANRLTSLEGLPALPVLEDLWLGSNEIASFDALHPVTKNKLN